MFVLQSFAKINWGLWLLGKRPDGFHEIFTPLQKISLCDYIEIKPSRTLKVVTSNGIPQEENFVYKGLLKFAQITGIEPKFEIFIDKRIPVGGGLGGGSSNLATVLDWVNRYFNNPLTREELIEVLASISSDAPAFLCDGLALAQGRGEKIACLNNPRFKGISVTLLVPEGISSPTGYIYSKTNPSMFSTRQQIEQLKKMLEKNVSPEEFAKYIENPLGEIFLSLHPEVKEDVDFLRKRCYKNIFVSGSGSSLYAVGSLTECLKGKTLDRLKVRYKIILSVTI